MDKYQLNPSHLNTEVTIKASVTQTIAISDDSTAVKLQSLASKNGEFSYFLGGTISNELIDSEIFNCHKVITGNYIMKKSVQKPIYLLYIEIKRIAPLVLEDDENYGDHKEEESQYYFFQKKIYHKSNLIQAKNSLIFCRKTRMLKDLNFVQNIDSWILL